jgi:Spy/CpxP family protein refolding chaperone
MMKRTGSLYVALMALTILMMVLSVSLVSAQTTTPAQTKEEYKEVIAKRAEKIVATLGSTDAVFNKKVSAVVADQYMALGSIHDERNAKIKAIKTKDTVLTADDKAAIDKLTAEADKKLGKLHAKYLAKLSKLCTPEQVEGIKNGMTYNVLNVTYTAYQEMLPGLTAEQKKQILDWLTEAREHAMDAESSDKKHAWFGKYKGRINNYLAKAGVDMKQAEKEWQERIREKKEAAKQSK